jgi:phosphoribosylglycinamide formyltransferase-1
MIASAAARVVRDRAEKALVPEIRIPADGVVLLVVDNSLCRIAACSLAARFPDLEIMVEDHVARLSLVRSRIKRFGIAHTVGQLAFILFSRLLRRAAAGRIAEIVAAAGLEA